MSLKLRRYNANESEFTRTGRTRATIDVPGGAGFTDLTQSKLILDMQMNATDSTGASVLWPCTFGQRGQMVGPQALLRNSKVTSREHGFFNERRHGNVEDANLDWYGKSRSLEDAQSLFGNTTNPNYGCDNRSGLPDNPWLLYNLPTDTAASTQDAVKRRADIAIDWRHIDQFGGIKQFPNVAIGELHYQLEFEDQFNVAAPAVLRDRVCKITDLTGAASLIGTAAVPLVTARARTEFERPPMVGDQVTVWFHGTTTGNVQSVDCTISAVAESGVYYSITIAGGVATAAAAEVCTDVHMIWGGHLGSAITSDASSTIGTAASPIVIPNLYSGPGGGDRRELHATPYYVGMPVTVMAEKGNAIASTSHVSEVTAVSKLTIDGDDLKIELATPLNVGGAAAAVPSVRIAPRDYRAASRTKFIATWQIDEIYLQLAEIQLTPKQFEEARKALSNLEIPWMEHRLIQKNMPATTVHTEVVHADANCVGLAVLTPQNLELLSGFDNCERYRFAIDGKETTNRDVLVYDSTNTQPVVGRQLHNHMLKKYWGNVGKTLKKYDANYASYASPDSARTHAIYPLVTPVVPREQIIQLQLFNDSGTNMQAKNLHMVFTHLRTLKISNGRVMVM